jgi:imidazolonepropionase-like amidohydrolase
MKSWQVFLGFLAAAAVARGQEVQVFRGATVHPVAGPTVPNATLVVQGGRVLALGPAESTAIPAGAAIHELAGRVIIPGLVDTHTHLSGAGGADGSTALDPTVRQLDGVDVRSPQFVKALSGGITTVNQMSGSGHLMSGQTIYLKLRRAGTRVEDWLLCADPAKDVCGGMKMANGTNSIGTSPFPGTRSKSAAMARELFVKAQEYQKKIKAAGKDAAKLPDRDLGLEALVEILEGRRIVHFHSHRHDDILTALRLAKEFGFTPVIHHGSESYRVAAELAAAGAPVSLTVVDSPGGKEEALLVRWEAGKLLRDAGVAVAVNTDDWITDSRLLLRSAALTVRAGLDPAEALLAVTLAPARMLGLGDRVGSLEPGKDADFVVLSGDPFAVRTQVLATWVEGQKVFDREAPEDRLVAEGGYGAFEGIGEVHLDGETER